MIVDVKRGSYARLPILIPPKTSAEDPPPPPTFRTTRIGPEGRVGDFVVQIQALCQAGCHALVQPAETDYDPEVIEVAELLPLREEDLEKFGATDERETA